MVMLTDAPRVKYDKKKSGESGNGANNDIVENVEMPKDGNISDFFK